MALALIGCAIVVYVLVGRDTKATSERAGLRETHEIKLPGGAVKETREFITDENGNQIAHGIRTLYHGNGEKKMAMPYKRGKQVGPATFWHDNGKKSAEGGFLDGKRHGKVVTWHKNGKKASEGTYRGGRPHGKVTTWLDDGTIFEEGQFINGQRDGVWSIHREGSVFEVRYDGGKLIRE